MTSTVSAVEEARPKTREIARPWKIGSVRMKAAPIIAAAAVRKIGLKRIAPASISACAQRDVALGAPMADEVDEQDRVAHDDAGERDEADHRRRGEGGAQQPVAEHDADQRQRHRDQDHERQQERAELGDDEQIDAEDRHHEGRAHVAEGDVGDLPFAVPQQRRLQRRRPAGRGT